MREHLNAKEVAELLNISVKTIQRKAKNGEYPKKVCGRFGRFWLFNRNELLSYIYGESM